MQYSLTTATRRAGKGRQWRSSFGGCPGAVGSVVIPRGAFRCRQCLVLEAKVRRLRYHQLPCQKPIARLPVGVREADGVANDQACSPFEAIRMKMCPGVWPRLSTVPILDTTSAPGLIRVVRSVISLKAACVPGIMPRQRSGKEPCLDGGEICHVGARRAAADAIAVVARAMVGRKSLDSAATAGVTSTCRASPDSARRSHGRPRCGPPRGGAF
jgi:hypothetical protein